MEISTTEKSSTVDGAAERSARLWKTAAYYAAFITLGLTGSVLGPTLPGLAEHTGTGLSQISILFTATSLGYLVGSLQGGRLYDRYPYGHRIMAVMLIVMAAALALAPTVPLLILLAAVLLLMGIGQGTLDVGANTLIVWVHREKVGPFMNGLHFFFGLGAFLSPIIIAQAVLRTGDIYWAFWMLALIMLPISFFVSRLPSPPIHRVTAADREGRSSVLLVALIATFFFLYVGLEAAYGGWIYTYAIRQLPQVFGPGREAAAAYLTSAFWGALMAGRLAGVPISTRVKPLPILAVDLAGCIASLVLVLLFPDSMTALWIGTLAFGFANASIFATMLTLAERQLALTGRITSWFFAGSSVGGMFLPWMIGPLVDRFGPRSAIIAILIDVLLTAALFLVIAALSKKKY